MGITPEPDLTLDNQIEDLVILMDESGILDYIDKVGDDVNFPDEDISPNFTAVKNQCKTLSCSAHAATAIIEYFEKVVYGIEREYSRLFLYKVSRKYAQDPQDHQSTKKKV